MFSVNLATPMTFVLNLKFQLVFWGKVTSSLIRINFLEGKGGSVLGFNLFLKHGSVLDCAAGEQWGYLAKTLH